MEFGDIIYLILLVFFMILGFFNDSRKKKNQQKQQPEKPSHPYSEMKPRPFIETYDSVEEEEEFPSWFEPKPVAKNKTVPPEPPVVPVDEGRITFRSSMELTTDFAKESSLKSSIFVYDADTSYSKDANSPDIAEMPDAMSQTAADEKKRSSTHPLVAGLYGESNRDELLKGLIIGDIIRRKY
ncbi:MAG: hypothetical protein LLF81_07130 [Porphyromonadaceae bacterium]|nr:hypothetical protein [Porphyromonadaceae bacterium]